MAGVVVDVLADSFEVAVVADDVVVIIALPNGTRKIGAHGANAFGDDGFELHHDGAEGIRWGRMRGGRVRRDRCIGRGEPPVRPYEVGQYDDAVDVVGHDDVCVQFHIGADGFGAHPFVAGHFTERIQMHHTMGDFTEQPGAVVGDDGDVLRTHVCVIVPLDADRTAMEAIGGGVYG